MYIKVVSDSFINDKECFNCERTGCKERKCSNRGYLMFYCKDCDSYLCLKCTGGTFTEIIPC